MPCLLLLLPLLLLVVSWESPRALATFVDVEVIIAMPCFWHWLLP
jgi:hypothetical protein